MARDDDDAHELLTSVARLYYLDNLDQQAIAGIIGVSRSTVSRLLTAAREQGIVRISVDPYEPRDPDLEARLATRFGLRHAVVVKSMGRAPENLRRAIGYFAAPVVGALVQPGMTVGVAGGRTLGELIGYLGQAPGGNGLGPGRNLTIVQLMGHIDPTARRMDAPELSRELGSRLGGVVYVLNAPAFVQDQRTRDALVAHDHMRLVWERFDRLQLALVGIGSLTESAFVERGVLDAPARVALQERGAIGEIVGRFYDRSGRECASDFRDRTISIELSALKKVPEIVGVTNGLSRAEATLAALRGGLLTSLVIDSSLAEALLAAGR